MSALGKRSILNLYGGVGYEKHFKTTVTDDAVSSVGTDSKFKFQFHQVDFKNNGGDYTGDVVDIVKTIHDMKTQDNTATSESSRIEQKFDTSVTSLLTKDIQLQADLITEAQTRLDNDNSIQVDLDAYKLSETTARQNGDNALTLSTTEQFNTIQSNITAETNNRSQADITLQSNIDNETSARSAAILSESNTRMNKDNQFAAELLTLTNENKNTDNVLQGNITIETNLRIAADNQLQVNIDNENTLRISGDASLQTSLNNEAKVRGDADLLLQSNIDVESDARRTEDTTLHDNLDTETQLRLDGDASLQTNINTETTSRNDADTALQSNINAEAVTRGAGDTNLQENLNTVESNLGSRIDSTNSRVDAILAGSGIELDTLKELVDNYNLLNTDAVVMVTQNTTDINYLLRVVGTLLKTNEETSGHSSVEGATGATGAVARALVTPHNLTSDTSDPDFKLTSEGFGSNAGYPIWKAFDNLFDGSSFALVSYGYDTSTGEAESTFTFNPGTGAINGSWIKITLNETKSFNTFKFAAHSIPVMGPSSYTIYGSNDDITYTSFYSNVNYYPVGASGSYDPAVSFATQEWRYIVLQVTKNVGPSNSCSLMEIDFSMV